MRALARAGLSVERHRLRDVHASARRSRRLEHEAGRRPLGADLSERALSVRQGRIRLLDRAERQGTRCRRSPTACCRWSMPSRAEIVGNDFAVGDHLRILPTPGHTPGHVAFALGRGKDDAVFAGDLMHSPLQLHAIPICRRNSMSIRRRRPRRGAISWSAIATPIRCAAPRISPRPRPERSAARGNGFCCEAVAS